MYTLKNYHAQNLPYTYCLFILTQMKFTDTIKNGASQNQMIQKYSEFGSVAQIHRIVKETQAP